MLNKYSFSASDNYEVRRILHKLERLPPDQRKLVIDDIRPEDFSSQEYARIRAINGDRAKDYLHVSIAILTYIVHEYLLYLKYVWCLTEKVTIPHVFLDNKERICGERVRTSTRNGWSSCTLARTQTSYEICHVRLLIHAEA